MTLLVNLYSCRGLHPAHEVMYTMLDSICTSFRTAMEAVMQFSQASFSLTPYGGSNLSGWLLIAKETLEGRRGGAKYARCR